MARYIGTLTSDARGKLGGLVLTRARNGTNLKAHAVPVNKATIMEQVWQQPADSRTNVVNVYMKHLRKKIDLPGLAPLLRTIRGAGFALREDFSVTASSSGNVTTST